MIISKQFEFESSHHVIGCSSERCSHSVHGHSYKVEVSFCADTLDNGQMVYDFGLMKSTIKSFIDSMDHTHIMWDQDDPEYNQFFKMHNDRWIEAPFNPSAEMLSVFILRYITNILNHTIMNNGEDPKLHACSVRLWETRTGSAQCWIEDMEKLWKPEWKVEFSDGITKDWHPNLIKILINGKKVMNPEPFPVGEWKPACQCIEDPCMCKGSTSCRVCDHEPCDCSRNCPRS